MVHVTERARRWLQTLAATRLTRSGLAPRLVLAHRSGFGLVADAKRAGDLIVEHEGAVVLLIGTELDQVLAGSIVDFDENPPAPRLVIRRSFSTCEDSACTCRAARAASAAGDGLSVA